MATATQTDLRKAENFRRNLRRIFDAWGDKVEVAEQSGLHYHQLRKILTGETKNPGISTAEKIAIALEVALEVLLADSPSDAELRIHGQK